MTIAPPGKAQLAHASIPGTVQSTISKVKTLITVVNRLKALAGTALRTVPSLVDDDDLVLEYKGFWQRK
jgi:hypothetical protein